MTTIGQITDSRGVQWIVGLAGPTHAGSLRPGESIFDLLPVWSLRFRRRNGSKEVVVWRSKPIASPEEAKDILEGEPEWMYQDSATG